MKEIDMLIKKHLGKNSSVETIDKTLKDLEERISKLEYSISKNSCFDLYSEYGKLSARFESLSIARSYINSLDDIKKMKDLGDFSEGELEGDLLKLKENLEIKLMEYSRLIREE